MGVQSEVEPEQLADGLLRAYGIAARTIEPGPRGFVAVTYIVDAAGGQRLFAKVLPAAAHLVHLPATLAVLAELHARGIAVNRPLRTSAGQWTVPLAERTLVLFDFIPGRSGHGFHYDFAEFVTLLARIHQAIPPIPTVLPREAFGLPFAADFQRYLAGLAAPPRTPVQADLRRLLAPYQAAMATDWATLQALAAGSRATRWVPRLTHSDAPGDNVIIGADGRLYLVDWDDLMLGPPERDNWFHLNAREAAAFLQTYRQTFPDYQPDPTLRRFYIYRRFFEDLTGYLIEIADSTAPVHQAKNLADLEQTCFTWLWPLMHDEGATGISAGPAR
jgi:spectinomycin phosphotransferase